MQANGIECALALCRAPHLAADARTQALPDGMLWVIRLAAGDTQALAVAAASYIEPADQLIEACAFYVQQVMLIPGTDAYRVLGVRPDDEVAVIREHHRWLIRWLHPDRIGEDWLGAFAERVNQAWHQLRHAERRHQYDAERVAGVPEEPGAGMQPRPPRIFSHHALLHDASVRPPRARRTAVAVLVAGVIVIAFVWRHATQAPTPSVHPPPLIEGQAGGGDATGPATFPLVITPRVEEPRQQVASSIRMPPSAGEAQSEGAAAPVTPPPATLRAYGVRQRTTSSRGLSSPPQAPRDVRTAELTTPHLTAPRMGGAEQQAASLTPSSPLAEAVQSGDTTEPVIARSVTPHRLGEEHRAARVLAFLGHFQGTYQRGDLDEFMALFSTDARNNRGGRDAIREDYAALFAVTRSRQIFFDNLHWQSKDDGGALYGRFRVRVEPLRGRRFSETRGDIHLGLVFENDAPRITSIWHAVE